MLLVHREKRQGRNINIDINTFSAILVGSLNMYFRIPLVLLGKSKFVQIYS